jgi:hypothetical protein
VLPQVDKPNLACPASAAIGRQISGKTRFGGFSPPEIITSFSGKASSSPSAWAPLLNQKNHDICCGFPERYY